MSRTGIGRLAAGLLLAALAGWSGAARAQESKPAVAETQDQDPTKTVAFNLRYEHRELPRDASADLIFFRRDAATAGGKLRGPGHKVAIFRFDLPMGWVEAGGQRQSGLSDLYAQAMHVHPIRQRFSLGAGSGVFLPTATENLLGTGKWQVAPLVLPLWTLTQPRGLFFCKVQENFSVAGDEDRRDVNVLAVTPTLIWQRRPKLWLLADSEAAVDWERDTTSYKSGLLVWTTLGGGRGVWFKVEVPWGEHRLGDWTLKASIAWRGRG